MNVSVVSGLLGLALGVLVVAFLGLGCRFFLAGIKYFNENGMVGRPGRRRATA